MCSTSTATVCCTMSATGNGPAFANTPSKSPCLGNIRSCTRCVICCWMLACVSAWVLATRGWPSWRSRLISAITSMATWAICRCSSVLNTVVGAEAPYCIRPALAPGTCFSASLLDLPVKVFDLALKANLQVISPRIELFRFLREERQIARLKVGNHDEMARLRNDSSSPTSARMAAISAAVDTLVLPSAAVSLICVDSSASSSRAS